MNKTNVQNAIQNQNSRLLARPEMEKYFRMHVVMEFMKLKGPTPRVFANHLEDYQSGASMSREEPGRFCDWLDNPMSDRNSVKRFQQFSVNRVFDRQATACAECDDRTSGFLTNHAVGRTGIKAHFRK